MERDIFNDIGQVFEIITPIINFSPIGYLILVLLVIFQVISTNYLIPFGILFYREIEANSQKEKKRQIIKQIAFQKQIDEEIELEIAKDNKKI